jgi:uncharacterized membrane protein
MKALWHKHPGVRSGNQLTLGERAADRLKQYFGSWGFLLGMVALILLWITVIKTGVAHFDSPDLLLLNLTLSIMAGLQGGALQIASNRGDRVSSELALHTFENGQQLLEMNKRQLELLEAIHTMQDEVAQLRKAQSDANAQLDAGSRRGHLCRCAELPDAADGPEDGEEAGQETPHQA